ncbi:unnamed protein product, partial [Pylaiella littoralis]
CCCRFSAVQGPSARGYDVGAAGDHPAASQPYCATLGGTSVSYVLASRLRCRRPRGDEGRIRAAGASRRERALSPVGGGGRPPKLARGQAGHGPYHSAAGAADASGRGPRRNPGSRSRRGGGRRGSGASGRR